jgi:amino acid transporter
MVENEKVHLKRALGFWALAAYGIGDILGAGIYALMGKVAGTAGYVSWLSFLVSLVVAGFTALSYSELVTRFPYSGGESFYTEKGFRRKGIALVTGWLVFCAGTFSLAAISRAFSGYLQGIMPAVPGWLLVTAFMLLLGYINFRGIRESSIANIICTLIEASGLIFVVVVGLIYLKGNPGAVQQAPLVPAGDIPWGKVLQGSALAFFAFIGFQDMVNVAEEVREPARDFPKAIITALAAAGGLYIVIAVIATVIIPPEVLGQSSAPLLEVVRAARGSSFDEMFTLIALFAVANTGLLNFIMSSRLLYGMSRQKLLPSWLERIDPKRQTPHFAIGAVLLAALVLALTGTIEHLAGTTSVLLLVVYVVVNLSLVIIKFRKDEKASFSVPIIVPLAGALTSLGIIAFSDVKTLVMSLVLIAVGTFLVVVRIIRTRPQE